MRTDRDAEIKLYEKAYRSNTYRMGVRRKEDVTRIVAELPRGTILDVGCGRGELLTIANKLGHRSRGIDPVPYLSRPNIDTGCANQLPYDDLSYDYVVCFDVLEHLIEDDLIPALKEMKRVARLACIVSASEDPSIHDGVDLHISKRPADDWLKLIKKAWGRKAYRFGNAGRSPCFRVDL